MDKLEFHERLRVIRKRQGLTQNGLAKKAGVSQITVSWLENKRVEPRLKTVRKLGKALGVNPGYLLVGGVND